jgi:hypothetical protein
MTSMPNNAQGFISAPGITYFHRLKNDGLRFANDAPSKCRKASPRQQIKEPEPRRTQLSTCGQEL